MGYSVPAWAQSVSPPVPPCTTPETCPPPPAQPPPAYSPAFETETRARYEAEAARRVEPEERAAVAQRIDVQRWMAWTERGRIPERDPVPLRYPIVQSLALGGGSAGAPYDSKSGWSSAVQASLAARVLPTRVFGFELGGGVMTRIPEGPPERFRAITIEPAAVLCVCGPSDATVHTVTAWARGSVQLGLPVDGGRATPDAFLAFRVGLELDFLAASFGDGGFAAAAVRLGAVLDVPIGGEAPGIARVTFGPELLVGPSVAF